MSVPHGSLDGSRNVRLGELGTWVGGGTPRKSTSAYWEKGTVPWLSPKDMRSTVLNGTQDKITELGVDESATKRFPAGSIAFVVRSGILEHTLPVALVPFAATANQDMRVLVPDDSMDTDWLLWTIKAFSEDIRRSCQKDGTTVASLDVDRLMDWEICVPPEADQLQIAKLINEVLPGIDHGSNSFESAARRMKDLRASTLRTLTKPTDKEVRVDEVGEVFVGATPRRSNPELWDGEVPWVSSSEVAFCRIKETRECISADAVGNRDRRLHPPGTVLLAMYGEGRTRGQAAILDIEATTNQAIAAVRLDTDRMLPEFLYYRFMAQYQTTRAVGHGGQQINLNKDKVRALMVPCPPLSDQRDAVAHLVSQLDLMDRLEADLNRRRQMAVGLRTSFLRAAVSGELSPTDTH